jgi:CheY-like chemotaxis protein
MPSRILIVDDDDKLRHLISRIVRVDGWTPLTAANGHLALDILRDQPYPDVILLDLLMPLMNGWQFRARQLANPTWAAIPVVVLSGAQSLERAMRTAAFVPKPFTFDQLLTILRQHAANGCSPEDALSHRQVDALQAPPGVEEPHNPEPRVRLA